MVQKNHRTIVVTDWTYETLKQMGFVTESFDDVIRRLIEKVVPSGQTLAGTGQMVTTVTRNNPPGGRNGISE